MRRLRGWALLCLAVAVGGYVLRRSDGGQPVGVPPTAPAAPAPATSTPAAGPAMALLGTLPVKGRAPLTGYVRARFGTAWTDDNSAPGGHNGCRTREDILRRDLTGITSDGCLVLTGTLLDPYSGTTVHFVRGQRTSALVQIDHVVALADAWQTGAQRWDPATRTAFANDPLNLLAVSESANESKRAADAASWLPPAKAFRCRYVARQVAVKARYGLWVTAPERDAIARVLRQCPGQTAPA